jgi:adenine phosphoribosyltransferase
LNLTDKIRTISDFPEEGIEFKDITTLLKDADAYQEAINKLAERYRDEDIDAVIGIEARGFLIGAPLALELNKGFVPVRKEGNLPGAKLRKEYDLEYGSSVLEMHEDSIYEGEKVLIVDDLLATGGTVGATVEMVEEAGGDIVEVSFLMELEFLNGRDQLEGQDVFSLIIE